MVVVCAGLRTAAFFFGHQVMHLIDIVVQPAIFMSVYYTLTLPEIKFINYYISASNLTSLTPACSLFCWHTCSPNA